MSAGPHANTVELLERLVAFDTTSRNSNLQLIDFVRDYLDGFGVASRLVFSAEGDKANLHATIGPEDRPGIALSGHTDVVPVDGQDWSTDPFEVTEREGRLHGRGTADMKGFVAICLRFVPEFLSRGLARPVHLCFSYDEEVGCIGARGLIEDLATLPCRPSGCIVGEPTRMQVIRAHKGKTGRRCTVRGLEGHSGLPHRAVNAVEAAAEAIAFLKRRARRLRDEGPYDEELEPPYGTVHTGVVRGGTALNIVPGECTFDFEYRFLPDADPGEVEAELFAFIEREVLPEMHAVSADTGFDWEPLSGIPALATTEDADIVRLAKSLTGANTTSKVSFGTEAGLFHQAGIPAVVCGPGDIAQAHKPDEFVTRDQLARCERFVEGLIEHLRGD